MILVFVKFIFCGLPCIFGTSHKFSHNFNTVSVACSVSVASGVPNTWEATENWCHQRVSLLSI